MNNDNDLRTDAALTFPLPGYYSFVPGEVTDRDLINNHEYIFTICNHVAYSTALQQNDALHFFIRNGIDVLQERVLNLIHHEDITDDEKEMLISIIRYWYNRQYLVQLTSIPKLVNQNKYYSLPIKRQPNSQVQMDILQFNKYFREVNLTTRYLVVIVEIYSRYVWAAPTKNLKVNTVARAVKSALTRPGLSNTYYQYLKNRLTKVVFDGGSEFKRDFPTQMQNVFNRYTTTFTAPPKNQTFGRPTITGPIESAILELRKIMRDYSLEIDANVLGQHQEGLNKILDQYNKFSRIAILKHNAPANVVLHLMGKNVEEAQLVEQEQAEGYSIDYNAIDRIPQFMIDKIANAKKNSAEMKQEYPIVTKTNQGYGYRIYIPQGPFPKQVDIRVSSELYYIVPPYNNASVNLREFTTNRIKQNVQWKALVLVKTPIQKGPAQIEQHIKQEVKDDVVLATTNVNKGYNVTRAIAHQAGHQETAAGPRRTTRRTQRREFYRDIVY